MNVSSCLSVDTQQCRERERERESDEVSKNERLESLVEGWIGELNKKIAFNRASQGMREQTESNLTDKFHSIVILACLADDEKNQWLVEKDSFNIHTESITWHLARRTWPLVKQSVSVALHESSALPKLPFFFIPCYYSHSHSSFFLSHGCKWHWSGHGMLCMLCFLQSVPLAFLCDDKCRSEGHTFTCGLLIVISAHCRRFCCLLLSLSFP